MLYSGILYTLVIDLFICFVNTFSSLRLLHTKKSMLPSENPYGAWICKYNDVIRLYQEL